MAQKTKSNSIGRLKFLHKKKQKFEINVEAPGHKIKITLNNENDTILMAKREIEKELKIDFNQQELEFSNIKNQTLINDKTFKDYNIKSGQTLICIIICDYVILDAITKKELFHISSTINTISDKKVIYLKSLIEKKLIETGLRSISIKDQFLIYNNKIMNNDDFLDDIICDVYSASIYLQYDVICDECKENKIINKEYKQTMNELKALNIEYDKIIKELQSNIIELNFQNNMKNDKILMLQSESEKEKQDIMFLSALNEIKEKISDHTLRAKLEEIEILKKNEIEKEKENNQQIVRKSMNAFEDYASYFGDRYPMEASIISYYEGIMLMFDIKTFRLSVIIIAVFCVIIHRILASDCVQEKQNKTKFEYNQQNQQNDVIDGDDDDNDNDDNDDDDDNIINETAPCIMRQKYDTNNTILQIENIEY